MAKQRADLSNGLRLLAAEELWQPRQHPDAEELVAYSSGRLEEAERERLKSHLAVCPECVRILLDLAGQHEARDPELAAAWESSQARLPITEAEAGANLSRAQPVARPSFGWSHALAARPSFGWSHALAAALFLVSLGLGGWITMMPRSDPGRVAALEQRITDLLQPQVVVPERELLPRGFLRDQGSVMALRVPADASFFILTLILSEPPSYESYLLVILNQQGEEVWSGRDLKRAGLGKLRIALARGFLPAGEYRLKVYGLLAGQRESATEYDLRLSYD